MRKLLPLIDHWLLHEVAFVSKTQAIQTHVNTQIPIQRDNDGNAITRRAYRAQFYGRAHIFEVQGGLIDVKGSGALYPALRSHQTGLASLGEMIREFIFEKAVQRILQHSGSGMKTLGSYAVIDWGEWAKSVPRFAQSSYGIYFK